MDIGSKIKNARISAELTQEQAAESIGVSRQTMSNWENGKTYPDIVSVVKMGSLYNISLDRLLKEEDAMSDYLDYLDESTNVVKSKDKLTKLVIVISYLAVWAASLIAFWLFMDPTGALGYSLMFQWFLFPITTFILSLLIGRNNCWGKWKWISPVIFGLMFMLSDYATFKIANVIANGSALIEPEFRLLLHGTAVSLVALAIGAIFYKCSPKKEQLNT